VSSSGQSGYKNTITSTTNYKRYE